MSDGITIEMDTSALIAALTSLGSTAQPYINAACKLTAEAIVAEARARLRRQLGPNATGATEASIVCRPAYDGNGYVVVAEREPFPALPLWIEKGTKKGKPGSHTQPARPYFYISAMLEEGTHRRRIVDAVQAAIDEKGLGDA